MAHLEGHPCGGLPADRQDPRRGQGRAGVGREGRSLSQGGTVQGQPLHLTCGVEQPLPGVRLSDREFDGALELAAPVVAGPVTGGEEPRQAVGEVEPALPQLRGLLARSAGFVIGHDQVAAAGGAGNPPGDRVQRTDPEEPPGIPQPPRRLEADPPDREEIPVAEIEGGAPTRPERGSEHAQPSRDAAGSVSAFQTSAGGTSSGTCTLTVPGSGSPLRPGVAESPPEGIFNLPDGRGSHPRTSSLRPAMRLDAGLAAPTEQPGPAGRPRQEAREELRSESWSSAGRFSQLKSTNWKRLRPQPAGSSQSRPPT